MATLYIKITSPLDGAIYYQRKEDNAVIPSDPNNRDYVEVLALCQQYGEVNIVETP